MTRVILTGTPGVGKTTVAKLLASRLKYKYVSLNDEIFKRKAYKEYDKERESYVIDIKQLEKICEELPKNKVIIEGHLAHYCKGDIIIVLRCAPIKLKQRMRKKGFNAKKIDENLQAEILDVILQETYELWEEGYYEEVYEIDTTDKKPERIVTIILKILNDKEYAKNYLPGRIDWTNELLEKGL